MEVERKSKLKNGRPSRVGSHGWAVTGAQSREVQDAGKRNDPEHK